MEASIEELLGKQGVELQNTLENLRRQEYSYAVSKLKHELPYQSRCVVCTLKLPCAHYSKAEDMPVPSPPAEDKSFSNILQGLEISSLNFTSRTPRFEDSKDFTVRFRGSSTTYSTYNSSRTSSLPNKHRLKTLEKIELYREERLKNEIEKLEKIKEQETKEQELKKKLEEKRQLHAKSVKKKLEKLNEQAKVKKDVLQKEYEEMKKKQKEKEAKYKKYIEKQKKKLAEYTQKKKDYEIISKRKVEELEEDLLKKRK
mmetsp:Transcript_12675/g.18493  ORF Transcript_12675/g.18493 Transcript_12675/m.18493 type:complete len:257 (-) Transcript_12675:39-809(-)